MRLQRGKCAEKMVGRNLTFKSSKAQSNESRAIVFRALPKSEVWILLSLLIVDLNISDIRSAEDLDCLAYAHHTRNLDRYDFWGNHSNL